MAGTFAWHYSASPVEAGGLILLTSEEGDINVVRDDAKFTKVASGKLAEGIPITTYKKRIHF